MNLLKKVIGINLSLAIIFLAVSGCNKKNNNIADDNSVAEKPGITNYFIKSDIPIPYELTFPLGIEWQDNSLYLKGISTLTEPKREAFFLNKETGDIKNIDLSDLPEKNITAMEMTDKEILLGYCNNSSGKSGFNIIDKKSGKTIKKIIYDMTMKTDTFHIDENGYITVSMYDQKNNWQIELYDKNSFEKIKVTRAEEFVPLEYGEIICDIICHEGQYCIITEKYNVDHKVYDLYIISEYDGTILMKYDDFIDDVKGWYTDAYINRRGNLCTIFDDNIESTQITIDETAIADGSKVNMYEENFGDGYILTVPDPDKDYDFFYWSDEEIGEYDADNVKKNVYSKKELIYDHCICAAAYGDEILLFSENYDKTSEPIMYVLTEDGTEKNKICSSDVVDKGIAEDIIILSNGDLCVLELLTDHSIIHILDENGKETGTIKPEYTKDQRLDISQINAGGSGQIYYSEQVTDGDDKKTRLSVYDSNGKLIRSTIIDDTEIVPEKMFPLGSNDMLMYHIKSESTDVHVASVDFKNGTIADDKESCLIGMTVEDIFTNAENTSFIVTNDGAYMFDDKKEKADEIIKWNDSDVYGYIMSATIKNKDSIMCILDENNGNHIKYLKRADDETIKEINSKKIINLAGANIHQAIYSMAEDFNNKNPQYRIRIEDYTKYAGDDFIFGGTRKLNLDILSDKIPDIFIGNSWFDLQFYSKKKLFTDLDEFIENDTEISKSDFLENILNCCKFDGKQMILPISFEMVTIGGSAAVLGEKQEWTYEEFIDLSKKNNMFYKTSRSLISNKLIYNNLNEFVDFTNCTCSFNSTTFKEILDFIKCEGISDESILSDDVNDPDYLQRFSKGLCISEFTTFAGTRSMALLNDSLKGEKAVLKGLPSSSGGGPLADLCITAAISESSENKEMAWSFIRELLSDDFQRRCYSLPVKKSVFDKLMKTDRTSPWVHRADMTSYNAYPVTDEDAEYISQTVKRIDKICTSDSTINSIIEEQLSEFFAGSINSSEAAEEIQRKVSVYLNEIK